MYKKHIQENTARKKKNGKTTMFTPVEQWMIFSSFQVSILVMFNTRKKCDFKYNPRDSLLYNEQSTSLRVDKGQVSHASSSPFRIITPSLP